MWNLSSGADRGIGLGALRSYLLFLPILLLGLWGGPAGAQTQTASVFGSVVDQNSRPIGSVTVSILSGPTTGRQALTNSFGAYSLTGLSPGSYTLIARRSGFVAQQNTISLAAGSRPELDFTLTADTSTGGVLQGTITRQDNRLPLANAQVTLRPVTGTTQTVTTGADGFYSFSGLQTATYGLTVAATGFGTLNRNGVTVRNGQTTTVNFQLNTIQAAVGTLSGQVKDPQGLGVANVEVRLLNGKSQGLTTTTNSSGFYNLRAIVPDTYNVRFSGGGFNTLVSPGAVISAGATTTLNVTLSTGNGGGTVAVSGTVQNPSGNPVVGARVAVTAGPTTGGFDITSTDGTYQLTGLPDGSYTLTLTATGFQTTTAPVTLANGQPVTQNFTPAVDTFSTFGAITGRITGGGATTTAPGATVTVTAGPVVGATTTADADGDYVLSDLQPGTYTLSISMTGQTTIVRSNVVVTSGVNTVVNASFGGTGGNSGTLSGTVVDTDGNGITGVTVTVKNGSTQVGTATTDTSGNFSLDVPAGTYSVQFSKSGFNTATSTNVTVTSGGNKVLSVQLTTGTGSGGTGTITGTVRDTVGRGVQGAGVELVGDGVDLHTQTNSSGRFEFDDVPVGTYSVNITAPGIIPTSKNVTVTDGKTVNVTFTIEQQLNTSSIAGVVRNPSGLPIQGAKVTVKTGPFAGLSVTTGSDGRFLFLGLPVGGYMLEAQATGFVTKDQVYFVRNGATSNLDFRLKRSTN